MKRTSKKAVNDKVQQPVIPPPLEKGDTIGLAAPAGPLVNRENFTAGVQIIEEHGYKVKFNEKLFLPGRGYLAGTDRERADEFNTMWADPEIKALVAARGGYGCLRMLDLIDMKQIRKKPKILIGFSDLTVLLAAIQKKTGLVTFHGPVVTTLASIDRKSETSFFGVLAGKIPGAIKPAKMKILKNGKAQGVLLGGNLTTLVHMIGTPYEISWENAILFIEDIGESPYRLDRLLTHLHKAKRLQQIRGLILGTFAGEDRKENQAMKKAVHARVVELIAGSDIPVWADFPVGHSRRNLTLPVGIRVMMDSSAGSLYL